MNLKSKRMRSTAAILGAASLLGLGACGAVSDLTGGSGDDLVLSGALTSSSSVLNLA